MRGRSLCLGLPLLIEDFRDNGFRLLVERVRERSLHVGLQDEMVNAHVALLRPYCCSSRPFDALSRTISNECKRRPHDGHILSGCSNGFLPTPVSGFPFAKFAFHRRALRSETWSRLAADLTRSPALSAAANPFRFASVGGEPITACGRDLRRLDRRRRLCGADSTVPTCAAAAAIAGHRSQPKELYSVFSLPRTNARACAARTLSE